jgi:hypothetical protein
MGKSKHTRLELNAMGMLLGMWYDHRDHTFNYQPDPSLVPVTVRDADTMKEWDYSYFCDVVLDKRTKAVMDGEIGCADGPFPSIQEVSV